MKNDFLKSVAGASIILTLLGFLSKGIGFIREIIYANKFGLSIEFDLFLISFTIPNIINTATIYLCQHYFIPAFNDENKVSNTNGKEFFNRTLLLFMITGLLISILLFFVSDIILELFLNNHSEVSKTIARNMFTIFLITIPISSGMSVIMAYQQAKFNFVTPAVSLTMLNVIIIAGLLLLSGYFKIYVLPISFSFAYLFSFGFLFVMVKRDIKILPFKSIFLRKKKNNFSIIISLILIEGLSLSYVLIDRLFISELSYGGISALNYAFVVFSLPISLFSIPLVTTLFSKLSLTPDKLFDDIRNAYGMVFYIMLPVTFFFYFWGDLIFILFYEGGKFTSSNTIATFSVLKYYSFGLVFISLYSLFVKIFYSFKKYDYVLIISVAAIIVKIVLSALLVGEYEEEGLALSTTLLYVFLMALGSIFLLINITVIKFRHLIQKFTLIFINLIIAFIISQIVTEFVGLGYLWNKIISLFVFISAYSYTSNLLNDSEVSIIKSTLKKLFNKN